MSPAPHLGTVLYTAKVRTVGGRDGGASYTEDGRFDVKHSVPGTPGTGTNPEQLFAIGWSACFEGAMGIAARRMRITLPADLAIDAEVEVCLVDHAEFKRARLNISAPGLERDVARAVIDAADLICPYSKATHGNIDVSINLL